jgi:hypothetical protein
MPAGSTYSTIATQTLGSAQSTVDFTSITGSYTDLVLVCDFQLSSAGGNANIKFNSATGNMSQTYLYGNGSSALSGRFNTYSVLYFGGGGGSANTSVNAIINIQNYSNTNVFKSFLVRYNDTTEATVANVGLWRSTSAITAINLATQAGNFTAGSTFTLYGIAAA